VKLVSVLDYLISGWSFFFRWPVANARTFRPVGVFLGPLLQTFVFLFFSVIGYTLLAESQRHWAPAFGFVGLSMLTGFFHEDGLADTADSLGVSKFNSHESLEKIHSTFKDPRLGTFGVSALVLFWAFRILAVGQGQISVFLWALVCLFSRTTSLGLGLVFSSRINLARSARSSHVMSMVGFGFAMGMLAFSCLFGTFLCFLLESLTGFAVTTYAVHLGSATFLTHLWCVLLVWVAAGMLLHALVRRSEALNGDLLGALVCISEVFLTICILRFF
jgi:cobalamin synthase